MKNHLSIFLLILIVGIGLIFRVWGSDWGYPLQLHPDEDAIADQAFNLIERGSWEPTHFGRPNHLSIYLHAFLYQVISPIKFDGQPPTLTYQENKAFFYQASRIFVAFFSAWSIVVAYLIGREFNKRVGLFAAGLFALFPVYVLYSHYIIPDLLLTLLTLLTVYLSMLYIKDPDQKYIKFMSLVAAASLAEKYPGLINLCAFGLVILLVNQAHWKRIVTNWLRLVSIFFVSLLIVGPFLLLRPDKVIEGIRLESQPERLGMEVLDFSANLEYYLTILYHNSGIILTIFAAIGVVYVLNKRSQIYLPLFLGVMYWISLSALALHWERWGLPMFITPLLLSAIGIDLIFSRVKNSFQKFSLIIILLFSFSALAFDNSFNLLRLTSQDTRVEALKFTSINYIYPENTLYEGYSPFSWGDVGNTNYNLAELNNKTINYVILSSYYYDRYLVDKNPKYQRHRTFFREVSQLELVKEFKPQCPVVGMRSAFPELVMLTQRLDGNCLKGPVIKIFRLD